MREELTCSTHLWQTGFMRVPETTIAQVVTEASQRMSDPQYVTIQVNRLRSAQPHLTQYVLAYQSELSVEEMISILFQISLIHECIARATGRHPSRVTFQELDIVAPLVPTLDELAKLEPDLASFILSNTSSEENSAEATQSQIGGLSRKILAYAAASLVR
jgi:hypothetical protein